MHPGRGAGMGNFKGELMVTTVNLRPSVTASETGDPMERSSVVNAGIPTSCDMSMWHGAHRREHASGISNLNFHLK